MNWTNSQETAWQMFSQGSDPAINMQKYYVMLETTSYSRYSGQRDTFPAGPQSPYLQPPKKHSIFDAFNTAAM